MQLTPVFFFFSTPVFLSGKSLGQKEPGGLQSVGSQKSQTRCSD